MTPNYHIPLPPSFPLEQLNQAQQDHGAVQQQEKGNTYVSRDEPSEHSAMNSTLSLYTREHEQELVKEEKSGCVLSIKWMSSKMRLMKKMMKNDRIVLEKPRTISSNIDTDNSSSNNSSCDNDAVRTCSDCNTTKTPLWRSGPRGPKSLCNACGIRQRKARRALAAAQAENSDTLVASETSSTSETKLHIKKKRCKLTARRSKKKLCFEDLVLSVSKNSAYYQVFPQDEKEAAILLMALSYGLAQA